MGARSEVPTAPLSAPEAIPEEFSAYEQEVRQLPVGEIGKSGLVRLEFEADLATGKTIASEIFSKVPLQVQRSSTWRRQSRRWPMRTSCLHREGSCKGTG